jgi:hypothetical protein
MERSMCRRIDVDRVAPTRDDVPTGINDWSSTPGESVPRPGAAGYSGAAEYVDAPLRIGVFGRRGSGKTALVRRLAGLPPIPPVPDNGATAWHRCRLAGAGALEVTESPALEDCAVHRTGMRDRIRTALAGVDLALLVMDPRAGYGEHEEGLLLAAEQAGIPVVGVLSKGDLRFPHEPLADFLAERGLRVAGLSAWTGEGCAELAAAISGIRDGDSGDRPARSPDMAASARGGVMVFVLPSREEAPGSGAGIDPAVVRDVVAAGGTPVFCRPEELPDVLRRLAPITPVRVQRH